MFNQYAPRTVHFCLSLLLAFILVAGVGLSFSTIDSAYAVTSAEKQAEADEIMLRIDALQTQYNEATDRYEQAMNDYENANDAAEKASERIETAREKIEDLRERISERAAFMYKNDRHSSFISVLLGAESFEEFLNLLDTVQLFIDQDATLVDQNKRAQQEAEDAKTEYESQKAVAAEQIKAAEEAQAEIESSQQALQVELDRVTEEVAMLKAKEEEERMKAEEAKRLEEEARRLAEEAQNSRSSGGKVNVTNPGMFSYPLDSWSVSSEYGWREWSGSFHSGIDLAAPSGSPIYAAADGVVSYVGWYGTGGNSVIVNHGNGYRTVYMHQSKFACSQGQQVSAGDLIGYVGSTGNSTGPHLHFNIEINGTAVNPRSFLSF